MNLLPVIKQVKQCIREGKPINEITEQFSASEKQIRDVAEGKTYRLLGVVLNPKTSLTHTKHVEVKFPMTIVVHSQYALELICDALEQKQKELNLKLSRVRIMIKELEELEIRQQSSEEKQAS